MVSDRLGSYQCRSVSSGLPPVPLHFGLHINRGGPTTELLIQAHVLPFGAGWSASCCGTDRVVRPFEGWSETWASLSDSLDVLLNLPVSSMGVAPEEG